MNYFLFNGSSSSRWPISCYKHTVACYSWHYVIWCHEIYSYWYSNNCETCIVLIDTHDSLFVWAFHSYLMFFLLPYLYIDEEPDGDWCGYVS